MNATQAEIDYYPLSLAASDLGISKATLRRWAALLRKRKIDELDHLPSEQVISAKSMQVYRRMVALRNQKVPVNKAVQKIRLEGI